MAPSRRGAPRESGRWNRVVPSHNAPYGLETHLTRPFADVVAALAMPLRFFLTPKEAALIGGMLSGPVLHLATATLVAWGAGAVLGSGGTLLAVGAFLLNPVFSAFGIYAYDHHALHLCLAAAIMALLLRHAVGGTGVWLAGAAGTVAGIAGRKCLSLRVSAASSWGWHGRFGAETGALKDSGPTPLQWRPQSPRR